MTRKPYPSDVSDDEWAFVAPYLTLMTDDAPQRDYPLREVFNGPAIAALNSDKITPDSLTRRPPSLEAFLKDWVETLRKRRQASRPIRELLALCAAAYGPLSSDDLQALAPDVFLEQTDIVDAVHDDEVARFVITVGEGQHTYAFSHQRLREVFLEQIYPPKDRERLQRRLVAYGECWYADRGQPLPDYLRQFWVLHLHDAQEWTTLQRVLKRDCTGRSGAIRAALGGSALPGRGQLCRVSGRSGAAVAVGRCPRRHCARPALCTDRHQHPQPEW